MSLSNSTTSTSSTTQPNAPFMNIVFVGHVDHGKSTVVGRMLADTHSLPDGKLEQVKENCARNSKPFEYAFLIDALKDEQSQGITIDSARVFFQTQKRKYIIIDAPGHIEFLKNMVTGAARADAALLIIDAREGVRENSKRHGYLLSMLGVKQIVVLINKMDLVDYSQELYDRIIEEYRRFLERLGVQAKAFIPVSGREGDMVAKRGHNMDWYEGNTVLETLDCFSVIQPKTELPLRMPVQDVYKFTNFGDDRRVIAGTIEAGRVRVGDEVVFYPSGKKSAVKSIERFNIPRRDEAFSGEAVGLTLTEQIYARRGDVVVRSREKTPCVSSRLRVNVFWLGRNPFVIGKRYTFKVGTARIGCRIDEITKLINAVDLETYAGAEQVGRHEAAEVVLRLEKAVAFDRSMDMEGLGRFVLVDDFQIGGGGIILEGLEDLYEKFRDEAFIRNYKWIKSDISREQRRERYDQNPAMIIITGEAGEKRKEFARALERKLFDDGRYVYYLGIGNVIHGVDADIQVQEGMRQEHLRRLAEVAHLMIDAGAILIVTAIMLNQDDLKIIQSIVDPDLVNVVWVGDKDAGDFDCCLNLCLETEDSEAVNQILKIFH